MPKNIINNIIDDDDEWENRYSFVFVFWKKTKTKAIFLFWFLLCLDYFKSELSQSKVLPSSSPRTTTTNVANFIYKFRIFAFQNLLSKHITQTHARIFRIKKNQVDFEQKQKQKKNQVLLDIFVSVKMSIFLFPFFSFGKCQTKNKKNVLTIFCSVLLSISSCLFAFIEFWETKKNK